ncbi:MAG TPA: hypothetical protein VIG99_13200 [Myxococcaceae bacterium]
MSLLTAASLGLAMALAEGPEEPAAAVTAFSVSGYMQADAVAWSQRSVDELDPSTGAPLNQNRFLIRRARVHGDVSQGPFSAVAEIDGNTIAGPSVRLIEARVSARWPADGPALAVLSAGLQRIPFGYEVRLHARDRFFLEGSQVARALFPGDYDLGIEIQGAWRFLRCQVAVMNGEPTSERTLPAADPNAAKDVVGRVAAVGTIGPVGLEVGVSGLEGAGFHPGTPSTKDTVVWRDVNEDGVAQLSELQVVAGSPATPSESFRRFALGGDLQLSVPVPALGRLELGAEVIWASNLDRGLFVADPVARSRAVRELGFSAGAVQRLPAGFAIGARFDRYVPDADARDLQGARLVPFDSSLSTWALAASWSWRRTARVVLELDLNDNALGRGADGAPARLASDSLTARAEVAF